MNRLWGFLLGFLAIFAIVQLLYAIGLIRGGWGAFFAGLVAFFSILVYVLIGVLPIKR